MKNKLCAPLWSACVVLVFSVVGCRKQEDAPGGSAGARQAEAPKPDAPATEPPPELREPVDLWKDGKRAGQVDAQSPDRHKYVFLDLGEGFTPILFTDGLNWEGEPEPHAFRQTYLALARGEFPSDAYGDRAKQDKYLELYGIMPTLAVLRSRLAWARDLECAKELDLAALARFSGVVAYQGPVESLRTHKRFLAAEKSVVRSMAAQNVMDPTQLVAALLSDNERAQLQLYLDQRDDHEAIVAAQARLLCEGYLKGKGKWTEGAFDWATHEALAEFERRHRVYSWGAMGPSTTAALRMETAQTEYEALLRVLTERAMHALGALEDGSARAADGTPATFKGADGNTHEVPNLEAELRHAVIQGLGLTDPEAAHGFLQGLGALEPEGHRYVAIPGPARPEYYASNMDLSVVIDRGDVWYEFPFDEAGKERSLPVSLRPRTTIFVSYLGQRIPLASFGTTIGGWKSELIENVVWWKYKGSPPGEVVWRDIVSAPVWLPPSSTPPRELLKRRERPKQGEPKWEPNYHETGPSYASAYGLVAAYHRLYQRMPDGTVRITGDEGIRSHGSVDYMSIMRRHSHGCHRLHNHIAVRLFSFVVSHRKHIRTGHQPMGFAMDLEHEEEKHRIEIKRGGYVFRLDEPLFVTVAEGRIRGKVERPIEAPIPKFNAVCKAYYLPDGSTVVPKPDGKLVATTPPANCDAGLPQPAPAPAPPEDEDTAVLSAVSAQPVERLVPAAP